MGPDQETELVGTLFASTDRVQFKVICRTLRLYKYGSYAEACHMPYVVKLFPVIRSAMLTDSTATDFGFNAY